MLETEGARRQETVAVNLANSLKRHGVEVLFGQSLPSALHLVAPDFGLKQVNYRTENAGGTMADGYARIANKIGVVTAQNGPAATLLVPPLSEAMKASVPILAICQEVDRASTDRNAFQEFDHMGLFASCTKWCRRVDTASRIEDYVDMAIVAATTGRPGPVALLFPADLLNEAQRIARSRINEYGTFPLDRVAPDPERVQLAARMIAEAEHPVLIAGGGVHLSKACDALTALQEAAALPVGTTNMGKGAVSELHPLSLGVLANALAEGSPGRPMRPILEDADLLVLVGTRTNQNGTDSWKLYPEAARVIHIDIDGMEVGRNYEAERLVGDARLALTALTEALRSQDLSRRHAGRAALEARIARARAEGQSGARPHRTSDAAPLRPERVMAEIDRRIGPDTIVAADASYSSLWVTNFLTATEAGQRFLTPRGLAGLGWGLPLALGAKAAEPGKRVVTVVGDGGFAHSWQELETARRMGLDVTVVLLNNGILGFQKHAELVKFGAHTGAIDFSPVDHAAIADATGGHGVRVETPDALAAALDKAFASEGVHLIEVITDPDAHPPITVFEGHI
ncbi:acetolactate synthase catalytic subunit [Acuticoccus sediminis]|uniref:acetolactate synthase catalytic subunit n=1 Tax=Acuticoccus sediminis TaxID=2184697 RepID=UPI001CFE7000|nr:acetolactate synthase catalytic subunit [Acuticoccus sediminis]